MKEFVMKQLVSCKQSKTIKSQLLAIKMRVLTAGIHTIYKLIYSTCRTLLDDCGIYTANMRTTLKPNFFIIYYLLLTCIYDLWYCWTCTFEIIILAFFSLSSTTLLITVDAHKSRQTVFHSVIFFFSLQLW